MLEAAGAALLLLRRRPVLLPAFTGDSRLGDIEELGANLEADLQKRVIVAQATGAALGFDSLRKSLPASVEIEASSDIETLRKLRAVKLAERFAADWQKRIAKAEAAGSKNPIADASAALRSRSETLLLSEAARSFNEEKREALIIAPRGMVTLRVWDCFTDPCDDCVWHDGETIYADESFSGGDEPSEVHPRCLCTDHYRVVTHAEALELLK
jgi:hypothetical protein